MGVRSAESYPQHQLGGSAHRLRHTIPGNMPSSIRSNTTSSPRTRKIHLHSQEHRIQLWGPCIYGAIADVQTAAIIPTSQMRIDHALSVTISLHSLQLPVAVQTPLHPPIHAQAPSSLTHFHHPAPPRKSNPPPDATPPSRAAPTPQPPQDPTLPHITPSRSQFFRQMGFYHLINSIRRCYFITLQLHQSPIRSQSSSLSVT